MRIHPTLLSCAIERGGTGCATFRKYPASASESPHPLRRGLNSSADRRVRPSASQPARAATVDDSSHRLR